MGQILSHPVTDKSSDHGENEQLYFGLSSMQGWRVNMEDAHTAVLNLTNANESDDKIAFFGVYDGHGGEKVAIYSGENLHNIVARQSSFAKKDFGQALKDGFLSTDRSILEDGSFKNDMSGCTATTTIITNSKIVCANAGDSRTILGVKGVAKPLSFDHKPTNEGERARICAAHGFVDAGRVNGNLALSRAIGDFDFKKSEKLPPEEQIVTAYPDVMEHEITPDDEFVVLACDGIWDCMHSQQVVEFVRRGIVAEQQLETICENLMDNCLAAESDFSGIGCDNMTVLIVALLNGKTKEEWYQMIKDRVDNGVGPVAPVSSAEAKVHHFTESPPQNSSGAMTLQRFLRGAVSGDEEDPYTGGGDDSGGRASYLLNHFGLRPDNIREVNVEEEEEEEDEDEDEVDLVAEEDVDLEEEEIEEQGNNEHGNEGAKSIITHTEDDNGAVPDDKI